MPPCSKLISHSYTTFETNVPNESVIKIDYLRIRYLGFYLKGEMTYDDA